MVTTKDMQAAFAALLRGDEAERDRILAAAEARDKALEAAKVRGAAYAGPTKPIKLERQPDGSYRSGSVGN